MTNTSRALKTVSVLSAKYIPHLEQSKNNAEARQVLEVAILAGYVAGQESALSPYKIAKRRILTLPKKK